MKTVQSRLGHASAVETLDTYSHLWPDSDDRTRDAIDSGARIYCGRTADGGGSDQLDVQVADVRRTELACKPDSVPRRRGESRRRRGGDHPSGHTVAGSLERPTRRLGRATLKRLRSRTCGAAFLALLRVGFA